jgi:hypothetical protein
VLTQKRKTLVSVFSEQNAVRGFDGRLRGPRSWRGACSAGGRFGRQLLVRRAVLKTGKVKNTKKDGA